VLREKQLVDTIDVRIRFSEVDSIGIVWHGNFIKYLEDGRESFGRTFGLGYLDVFDQNLLTPIVKMEINYKMQVKYGEELVIETSYRNCAAAKIILDYRIFRKSDSALVLTATTTQVFLNKEGILELANPAFYLAWKVRNGIEHQLS
jgi:acyl-CoA thioester hydrolase